MSGKLTPKQIQFCEEYLIDHNGKQAAIRAKYSPRTAEVQASQLLSKLKVQEYIQSRTAEIHSSLEISQQRILREYARLAFFDGRRMYHGNGSPKELHELDDDTAAAIAGLEIDEIFVGTGEERTVIGQTKKYKIANKLGALDSLARTQGMFKDKTEVSGEVIVRRMRFSDEPKEG